MLYDEDKILTDYVWQHYSQFLTPSEKAAGKAALAREEAMQVDSDSMRRKLLEMAGDLSVASAVEFRRTTRDRIQREHAAEVEINRCPRCERIVRSPRAQQCLWCGHDWHSRVTS